MDLEHSLNFAEKSARKYQALNAQLEARVSELEVQLQLAGE